MFVVRSINQQHNHLLGFDEAECGNGAWPSQQ